jgi:hypothetical protein
VTAHQPVISQQYSSATFVSLRFHIRKEKNIQRVSKMSLFPFSHVA